MRYKLPEATEVQKAGEEIARQLHPHRSADAGHAGAVRNRSAHPAERFVQNDPGHSGLRGRRARQRLSEADRASMTVCLKADQSTKMGIVTDVKQEPASCQRPEDFLCGSQVAGLLIRRPEELSTERAGRFGLLFFLPERRLAPFLPPSGHGGQDDGPAQSGTIRHGRRPSKPGNRPPRPHTIQSEQRGEGRNTPPTAATCRHPANKPRKTQAPRYRKAPAHNKDTDGRIRCPKSHPAENPPTENRSARPRRRKSSRTANGFPEGTVRLLLRTMPEDVRNRTPVGRFRG